MKVPISWLRDYIDLGDLSDRDLADRMTFAGIEIEGVETVGAVLDGVVVGEVVVCEPIPESDHLHRCRVFDGTETLDVVCGAPNCALGIKVPFAPVGTLLPGNFKIRRRKLLKRYESCGMLCSPDELGLGGGREGLLLLDPGLSPGTPIGAVLGPPETVFDVEITWNRPDVLSLIGVAREFAALLRRPVRLPAVDLVESGPAVESLTAVAVDDPQGCPRYTARILTGVERRPSPDWMKRRLELCGVRSIDVVVDISNYVMLECGQPLHTFDYDRLAGGRIVVRRARDGETLQTLDGQARALDPSMLVIADAEKPVAVAGVMGGADSEIGEATRTVLLESATFHAPTVKQAAGRLGLRTESSHRFERGVDPDLADWASRRAAELLVRHAGATLARGVVDADARPRTERRVTLRFQRVRDVLGVPLDADAMVATLDGLSIALRERSADEACFEPPSYRIDLEEEADLIEEIARLHGLDALPEVLPSARIAPDADDRPYQAVRRCRQLLADLGLHEAMHYSFLSAEELDAVRPGDAPQRVVLPNPVSADYAVLRDTLIPQMVGTLGRNAARQTAAAALFEMGRVFLRDANGRPTEEDRLCLGFYGPIGRAPADCTRPVSHAEALLWMKGILESLCAALHCPAPELRAEAIEGFQNGWAASVWIDDCRIGELGLATAALGHRWRMTTPMALCELRRDALLSAVFRTPRAQNVPIYPGIHRDVALIVDQRVTHGSIVKTIRDAAPQTFVAATLFDVFEGAALGPGKRSLAYSIEYRSPERTLRDEEANAYHETIKSALKRIEGVQVREG